VIPPKQKSDRPGLPCVFTPLYTGLIMTNALGIADFAAMHKQKLRVLTDSAPECVFGATAGLNALGFANRLPDR
jgi:hypothetical protein